MTRLSDVEAKRSANRNVLLFFFTSFLIVVAFNMQSPTLSLFAAESGASLIQIGMIISVGFVVRLITRVPIGLLSDRFGRKFLFCFGAICVASSLFILYLSASPSHIAVGQVVTALAFTTIYSVGMTMAEEMYRNSSGTGVAAFAVACSIAGLSAPLVCSMLLLTMPIRMTYLIAGIMGLAGIVFSTLLPKGHSVRKSLEVAQSLRSVLRNRGVQFVSLVQVFAALSDIAIGTYFPLLASTEMGLSASMIALLVSLYPLGMVLIRIPLPKIFGRVGPTKLLTFALATYMMAMVAMPLVKTLALLAVFICIAGFAHGTIWPSASLLLSHAVHSKDLGLANAVYGGTADAIGIAAPVVLSSIIELMGYSALYYTAFLFDLVGLLMISAWSARWRHEGKW